MMRGVTVAGPVGEGTVDDSPGRARPLCLWVSPFRRAAVLGGGRDGSPLSGGSARPAPYRRRATVAG